MTKRRTKSPATPPPSSSMPSSLLDLVLSHFDNHQRGSSRAATDSPNRKGGRLDAPSRAARLRDEISSELLNQYVAVAANLEDGGAKSSAEDIVTKAREDIIEAVILCVDATMESIASAKRAAEMAAVEDCIEETLDLAAVFACSRGDGTLGEALISRAVTLASKVQSDAVRSKACHLLGLCVSYTLSGAQDDELELGGRKKRHSKGKRKDDISAFLYGCESARADCQLESWRVECVNTSGTALLSRLTDKSQAVRLSAVQACGAFFEGRDSVDGSPYRDVLQALLARLAHDSSAKCRAAAARSLPVKDETVPLLLERIRDVNSKVRVEALEALRSKANVENDLTEKQRVTVLQTGLTERCSETNRATVEMLCCGWMKALKFDAINLLRLLDPVTNEAICERAVRAIVAAASDDNNEALKNLSDPEIRAYKEVIDQKFSADEAADEQFKLDPAKALYLRVLCDETENSTSLSPSEKANILGKLLPDIPALGQLMKKHLDCFVDSMTSADDQTEEEEEAHEDSADAECFVCSQLLKMARRSADLQEEGSRRHFVSLMCEMLSSMGTPDDLLEGCIMALYAAHDMETRFLQTVSEIVSSVGDNEAISDEDAEGCTDIVAQQIRVVSILSLALEVVSAQITITGNTAVLDGLSSHIVPAITSPSVAAREAGVGCLGRFALLAGQDRASNEFIPLLLQVFGNVEERMEVRAQAAMALCDLTLVYGDEVVQEDQEKEEEKVSFTSRLSEMILKANPAMVAVTVEIVAKLLLAGRSSDPTLLAHLIVVFFDKNLADAATADEDDEDGDQEASAEVGSLVRMQQILSLFFPAYAMSSRKGRETLTSCVQPLLSILETKMAVKGGSKRGRSNGRTLPWPIAKMVEFICSTVDAGFDSQEEQQKAAKSLTVDAVNDEDSNETSARSAEEVTAKVEEPSSTLLASIAITEFLAEQSATLTDTYVRTLCKILSGAYIDVETDDPKCLSRLKSNMDHVAMIITDDTSISSLEKLIGVLDEFESDDEGSNADNDSAASLAEAVQRTTLDDKKVTSREEEAKEEEEEANDEGAESEGGTSGNVEAIGEEFPVDADSDNSEYQNGGGNPAAEDEDDFFDDQSDEDDFMDVMSDDDDDDDWSVSSKENVGNKGARGKDGSASTKETEPRRRSTRRRQLANLNT